ncbi:hypothetical protein HRR83_004224 [Exophiala dermatitidis]|nr:hypothetical protein HRR73_006313 [Exophiala dermatitidis]KAJ4517802.1 hypothetical protein HRR75_003021 [Exophiala dermatitidis]KAJ4521470.1 hypothetical protein HRR74_003294 [Exophiala dermatitidis]KAJ4542144.1 hypothetical protein HRR77_006029 [Exophiala dermatitidis]KAJ4544909.1 hypothetical protein HRR76_002946 [Exophiala dermatitidis]
MTGLPPAVPPSAPQAAAQEGFRIRGRSARSPDRRHEHQQYDRYHDRSSDRDRDRERYYNNDGRGDGDRGRGRGAPSQGHGYGYDGTRSPSPAQGRSPRRPRSYYDNNRDDGARSRSPPPIRRSRAYYDRDDPRSTRYRDDSRSRSRGRGTPPGERPASRGKPSKEIMMEGLASHLTEDDISVELKQYYHVNGLDDVRVICDRQTKQSRGFGFLRFSNLQQAESFMDKHYPFLYLYGDYDKSPGVCKVRLAFGRERKEVPRPDEDDWICSMCAINNFSTRSMCFRCQAPRPEPGFEVPAKAPNVGDNDVSPDNAPSQFLLFRGLEPSVTEELLAKGVAKLNKPGPSANQREETATKKGAKVASTTGNANLGAKEGSLRRVLLVRDRRSNESWRYGFAEYASIEDAQAALTRYISMERFTIASKHVLVSYIHAGVFVPVMNPEPGSERFTFSPLNNPAMKLAYWDEAAYVTELAVSMPAPTITTTKSSITEPKAAKDTAEKPKKRKALADADTAAAGGVKKAAPSHLQFWSNRHAELHGIGSKAGNGGAGAGEANARSSDNNSDNNSAPPSQSYADPARHCCYLCMRQFTNNADVNKHERLSDLHRQNLKDEAKVKKAKAKLAKHGVKHEPVVLTATQYRDRARERRKIYGVFNKKGEHVGGGGGHARKQLQGSADGGDDPETATATTTAQTGMPQSKGASLLSKMGYTAGQGLGATGEGMTAPISQDIYVAGVGLGAEGGKLGDAVVEAERNTKGKYDAFAERTREGARERYARLE